jgi:cell division septation protein DedD
MAFKYLNITITSGIAPGPYDIYYDAINPSNYALLYPSLVNAANLDISTLAAGVTVRYPEGATQIILYNTTCNTQNVYLIPTPTPTTTTTPTNTETPTNTPTNTQTPTETPTPTPTPLYFLQQENLNYILQEDLGRIIIKIP